MRLLVIGGGTSRERDISLLSSKAVYEALKQTSHQVSYLDWTGDKQQVIEACEGIDVVVPILHGIGGEDGQIQAILEGIGVEYVGTDSKASKVCMDKQSAKKVLADAGILVPEGQVVDYDSYLQSELAGQPHVVKPIDEGSSFDTHIVPGEIDRYLASKIKASSSAIYSSVRSTVRC